jgi:hypothetical protein
MFSKLAYSVFEQIKDYHQFDNVDQPINNKDQFEHLLYLKTGLTLFNGILKIFVIKY